MSSEKTSLVKVDGKNYLIPFILVTSLFFFWGFAHSVEAAGDEDGLLFHYFQ